MGRSIGGVSEEDAKKMTDDELIHMAIYGINLSANCGMRGSDIGDKDDVAQLLTNLNVDPMIIDKKLKDVASEN
jgi:hypothetical protein